MGTCGSRWNCRKTLHKDSGPGGRTCLVPRWKASHLRHTGPMLLRPLSFADCSVSKPAGKWTTFLEEHEVFDFTAEDFKQDCERLRQVRARELSIESAPVRS